MGFIYNVNGLISFLSLDFVFGSPCLRTITLSTASAITGPRLAVEDPLTPACSSNWLEKAGTSFTKTVSHDRYRPYGQQAFGVDGCGQQVNFVLLRLEFKFQGLIEQE